MTNKKCIKCKQTKNLDEFHNSKRSKDGHHYDCKSCTGIRVKKVYNKYMGKARKHHQLTKKKIKKQCNACNKVKFVESFTMCGQSKGIPCYRNQCNKCMRSQPHYIKRVHAYKTNKQNKDRANMLARKRKAKLKERDGFRYTKGEIYSFYQYNKYLNRFLKKQNKRKCPSCNMIKPFNEYTKNTENHNRIEAVGHSCRKCTTIRNTIYKKSAPEVMQKSRKIACIKANKNVDEMSDNYIKGLITRYSDLEFSEIPDEFVQAKRQHLELKRATKTTSLGKKKRKYNENKTTIINGN